MNRTEWKSSIKTKLVVFNAGVLLLTVVLLLLISQRLRDPWLAIATGAIVFLIGLLGTYRMGTVLSQRLRSLVATAKRTATGDLQQPRIATESKDEIGELSQELATMTENFCSLVGQITETALGINSATSEIFSSAKQQEHSATEQAAAVEETRRTMEALLASSKQIAGSTQVVFSNAERTLSNNRLIAERIENLNTRTQRISEILEAIKDIADKSELLALNASLEGTRAGDAGRGFSLVAAEMRRLAEDVMGSVKNIKQLVGDIRESSHSSVTAAEEGMKLSEHTTDSARQITLITQQQQIGTEQVTQSMDEVNELLMQAVVGGKESTTAAQELMQLSERLRFLVFKFKLDEKREKAGAF